MEWFTAFGLLVIGFFFGLVVAEYLSYPTWKKLTKRVEELEREHELQNSTANLHSDLVQVDVQTLFRQVPDVPEAALDGISLAKEPFQCPRFGRTLYDNQVFWHNLHVNPFPSRLQLIFINPGFDRL